MYEPYELQIYSDLTTEHDDSIEILSCQLEAGESIYYKMGSGPTATCKEVVKKFTKREPTKKQRIIARIVMVVFMTMLTMSVLLVIVSLTMSEHIDDLGKSLNLFVSFFLLVYQTARAENTGLTFIRHAFLVSL